MIIAGLVNGRLRYFFILHSILSGINNINIEFVGYGELKIGAKNFWDKFARPLYKFFISWYTLFIILYTVSGGRS